MKRKALKREIALYIPLAAAALALAWIYASNPDASISEAFLKLVKPM
jgi:hypothetical protein